MKLRHGAALALMGRYLIAALYLSMVESRFFISAFAEAETTGWYVVKPPLVNTWVGSSAFISWLTGCGKWRVCVKENLDDSDISLDDQALGKWAVLSQRYYSEDECLTWLIANRPSAAETKEDDKHVSQAEAAFDHAKSDAEREEASRRFDDAWKTWLNDLRFSTALCVASDDPRLRR
jgi:hypothetical protein